MLFSSIQTQALGSLSAQQPFDERVLSTILIAASYPLYLYSNFSGYIDVVIGIARFLRMRLPENFNRPFSSDKLPQFLEPLAHYFIGMVEDLCAQSTLAEPDAAVSRAGSPSLLGRAGDFCDILLDRRVARSDFGLCVLRRVAGSRRERE